VTELVLSLFPGIGLLDRGFVFAGLPGVRTAEGGIKVAYMASQSVTCPLSASKPGFSVTGRREVADWLSEREA